MQRTAITSVELARRLKAAGLIWSPAVHDFFTIPWSGLEERVFVINEMATELMNDAEPPIISFIGAVEWSLDYVLSADSVWLPSESQLRSLLGETFVSLQPTEEGFRCLVAGAEEARAFDGPTAPEAYGRALLAQLSG